jgi:hypothetical protein
MSTDTETKYDVAFSFAGEDRAFVGRVAQLLRDSGVRVFYDDYEKIDLWGKNLYTHLRDVYQHRAQYTVMFISERYARKLWTNHERESAQARAFEESSEYILPVRFDDTEVPGVLKTTGYLDLRHMEPEELADAILAKLGRSRSDADNEPGITDSLEFGEPVVVWRLPRGFLVIEDVLPQTYSSWAITITYYGYDGSGKHGTHYHESYGRWWEGEGIETQFRKLMLPEADWIYAYRPLQLAQDIRHGRMVLRESGEVLYDGKRMTLDDDRVSYYPSGVVPLQSPPDQYVGLRLTGGIRDLVKEAEEINAPAWRKKGAMPDDLPSAAKRIRRQARIEIHELFPSDHPARINVEEIIAEFSATDSEGGILQWLGELAEALGEAAWGIRQRYEPEAGAS